ncbi:MAG: DNA repair protein RecO [Ignavibacteriae bacterium]|nr:DNA repair protein RecO [Ignavibacteriota bacterium]
MLVVKTEAIVLRTIKFKESSKIVTFYTKELGRVGAIVKGARRANSKIGAALEPMSHVQIVLYIKEGREVQTVGQCALLYSYHHFAADLEKLSVGLSIIELVYDIAHEQEQNIPLFELMADSLATVNKTSATTAILFFFMLKLAELLGFAPVFGNCHLCKKEINREPNAGKWLMFDLHKGSPVCEHCSPAQHGLFKISAAALNKLQQLSFKTTSDIGGFTLEQKEEHEIEEFFARYFQSHVTGFKQLRSRKIYHTSNDTR